MPGRRATWIARAIVVAATLALAHDLTFLARYGSAYGEALVHAGHGRTWTNAVLVCIALGAALLVTGGAQLWRLRAAASAKKTGPRGTLGLRELVGSWAGFAVRLAPVVAVLLTVQENVERAAIGIREPDPAILASNEYPSALAIVAAVAIAVSFIVALFRWRRDALLARIRVTITPRPRSLPAHLPPRRSDARRGSTLGRSLGLRAPPEGVAITIPA